MVLEMSNKRERGWEPGIFQTEAVWGKGIRELVEGISRHQQVLEQNGGLDKKLRARKKAIFLEILQSELMSHFVNAIEKKGRWDQIIDDLIERRTDPYSVVKRLMEEEFDNKRGEISGETNRGAQKRVKQEK
jgi:LAO/AO transport system kinase